MDSFGKGQKAECYGQHNREPLGSEKVRNLKLSVIHFICSVNLEYTTCGSN
jgi:hypothetical protein